MREILNYHIKIYLQQVMKVNQEKNHLIDLNLG